MDPNSINIHDAELREQDRWLPIANVARLMKNTLPRSAKVSKDAKECMQECVSEYISFVTSEASDRCLREKRKTINGEDILYSMHDLGFENYAEVLKIYLAKYREQQALKQERGETRSSKRHAKLQQQLLQEQQQKEQEKEQQDSASASATAVSEDPSSVDTGLDEEMAGIKQDDYGAKNEEFIDPEAGDKPEFFDSYNNNGEDAINNADNTGHLKLNGEIPELEYDAFINDQEPTNNNEPEPKQLSNDNETNDEQTIHELTSNVESNEINLPQPDIEHALDNRSDHEFL